MALPTRFAACAFAHPRWCALLLGALAACGFQPLGLWPLTLLAMAGLIALIARADNARRAAALGWLFGVGHFSIGNTWIATAFTYQANMPAWLGGIAVVLISLYLALFPMLATLTAWRTARRAPHAFAIALAGWWIVAEWLRSWLFTGFPWNPLGVVLLGGHDAPGWAGLARWFGTYGLSGLVVQLAGLPSIAAALAPHRKPAPWLAAIGVAVTVAAGTILPGRAPEAGGKVSFTLIQPDVRQEDLNDPRQWESQFARTARLSLPLKGSTPSQPRLVLWPESGVPDYLRPGYPRHVYEQTTYAANPLLARQRIGRVIGANGLLLTGAVDLEIKNWDTIAARNVITAIDGSGAIRGSYAKAHLVPFGEYLPLRWLLEPLGASRLVAGTLDFWPGPGPRTVDLGPWGQAGMQICYEIVFSGQVVDRNKRPDYLFNPSNDGWFGAWGPPQHLAQARLRAIEEGLPVLRATTTGISAVIDANGIVRQHVPRHVARRLDGTIPPPHAPTLFARAGNGLPLGWAMLLLGLSLVALRRVRR